MSAYRRAYLALLLARRGRPEALPFDDASELASVYASLHDRQDTMKWLSTAVRRHELAALELKAPAYAFLSSDPRFRALEKQVGL